MKTLKEQMENKCIHFTGMQNKTCSVGIEYDDVKDKTSRPYKIPCFKKGIMSGNVCEFTQFPSSEEVDKKVKELEENGLNHIKAIMAIKSHIKNTGEKYGYIKCPICEGDLHYSQAEINGHVHGKCSCGLSFME